MLTQFDNELFPNDCRVVEIPLHNQWVYFIQKNGSSSIRKDAKLFDLKTYRNQEIIQLSTIDVYLRDPLSRYISGVNTYLQHLKRDNCELDEQTCLWFATRYNFLNRHYLPQCLWLINLARYTNENCKIRLRNLQDLSQITKHNCDADIVPADEQMIEKIKSMMSGDVILWLFIDQMLLDMAGNTLTIKEILSMIKSHPSGCFDTALQRFKEVAKILDLS